MGNIVEYEAEGCYHVDSKAAYLAATTAKTEQRDEWIRKHMRDTLVAAALHAGMDQSSEYRLPNGVTLYGTDTKVVQRLGQALGRQRKCC